MTQILNQAIEVDKTWGVAWREDAVPLDKFFKHRVFLESYPVFASYLPASTSGKVLLEVGTGSGRHGLKFALENPEMTVIMTDLLEISISNVNTKINQLRLGNAEAMVSDATNLPFESNTFDIVFCDAVIPYIPNHAVAVSEMVRVLKPGGRLILSVLNWWNLPHLIDKKLVGKKYQWGYEKSFTRKELRKLAKKEGLRLVAEDGFAAAYGIFRLKYRHPLFRFAGRATSRLIKIVERFLGRGISRNFGFQIAIIADK